MDNSNIYFYFILAIWLSLFSGHVLAEIAIEEVNPNVTITGSVGTYLLVMDENNHEFSGSTDLFKITGVEAKDCAKLVLDFRDASSFKYKITEDCICSAIQSFDYEANMRNYLFQILQDANNYVVISLKINNIDDEDPTINSINCEFDETTEYTIDNTLCSCKVEDRDGWLSKTTFIIYSGTTGNEDQIFALEFRDLPADDVYSADVYMYPKTQLKYEVTNFYLFSIRAEDGAHHLSANQSAVVNVKDLRNKYPVWTTITKFKEFKEQEEQNYDVKAVDGDTGINAVICYYKNKEDSEEDNYISIEEKTGHVLVKPIDRDKNDITLYNFEMASCVCDLAEWCTKETVQFYIQDIDNNPPRIMQNTFTNGTNQTFDVDVVKTVELSYLENYDSSYNFSTLITDIDTGENAQFTVSLEQWEGNEDVDYSQAYLIVPGAGYRTGSFQISVQEKTYLDFEDEVWRNHKYYVVSQGILDTNKIDKMLVSVSLEDYNDEIPKFDEPSYSAKINETAKKDDQVTKAHATDLDAADKVLAMAIVGSYAEARLKIDSDGQITVSVANAFDYDILNSVYFQVTATDQVGHVTSVPVTLTIMDVNNKAPTINPVDHAVDVEENQKNGVILNVTITASDVDTTADLTSYIDWDTSIVIKSSGIVEKTDAVVTAMKFLEVQNTQTNDGRGLSIQLVVINNNDDNPDKPDFETFDTLYLSLVVEDRNTDPDFEDQRTKTATVLISITDVNDNPPYFPDSTNNENRTVQEAASKGTSVGFIKAIDPDMVDTKTYYYCTAEDEALDWVDVNSTTGAFSVKDDSKINADEPVTYYFDYTCRAYDGLFFSKPLLVSFYVLDTNNKDPKIYLSDVVNVTEKSEAGTNISTIDTTDMDRDVPFHTVTCNFISADEATAVCVQKFKINENVLSVLNGKDDIDRDTGTPSFTCTIECKDNEFNVRSQGSRTASKTFTIKLIDINDHIPELLTTDLECSESLEKEQEVGVIQGKDLDEGLNAEIDFTIVSVINDKTKKDITNFFYLKKDEDYKYNETIKQIHLITTEDLKGQYGTFTISLKLKDEGTPPLESSSTCKLTIDSFNFDSPKIIFPVDKATYQLLSSQTPGNPLDLFRNTEHLTDFTATDGATTDCSKWDVTFNFSQRSNEKDDIFSLVYLDSCKAQLQVNNNFKTTEVLKKTYNLTVTAMVKPTGEPENGEALYTSSVDVSLIFLDNTLQPEFLQNTWAVDFVEADTTQSKPLESPAVYDVQDQQDLSIYYYLISDNKTMVELFEMDPTTGQLSVIGVFYNDYDKEFDFQIVASNDTDPTTSINPKSYLSVTVTVLGTNRRKPQWKDAPFFGAVLPGSTSGSLITTVQAFDEDSIDQGHLTCSISSKVDKHGTGLDNIKENPFQMETTNDAGRIYLDFLVETTMSGYFKFNVDVQDRKDQWGHGPFSASTSTTIFIITTDNTVDFRFYNDIKDVQDKETPMLEIVTEMVGYHAYRQSIENLTTETGESLTVARLYFIEAEGESISLIKKNAILSIVGNVNTFSKLASKLRGEQQLMLTSFSSDNTNPSNSEAVLIAWLTGVSVVFGVLLIILIIALFLKTRQLNKRINKLTTKKFGSQESGLNRLGVSAPTTNKHAVEGSNPMYKNEDNKKPKNMSDFDTRSVRSGDSELIGVEDNPEFDYNFNKTHDDKTTYL